VPSVRVIIDCIDECNMIQTFRLRKGVLYQGMACSAFFSAAVIACVSIFFLEEPAKHGFHGEHSVAVVGGMGCFVFGTMLLISIYLLVAYYVEQFKIDGTKMLVRTVLRNREFDVSQLQRLRWKNRPIGGGIQFRLPGRAVNLALHDYANDDRLRIIRALHAQVPTQIQDNWPSFCQQIALPLRDGFVSSLRFAPGARFYTITRRRYDRMVAICFPLSLVVALAVWMWRDLPQLTALPVLVVAMWLLLRFSVPREGQSSVQTTSANRCYLIFGGSWSVALVAMLAFGLSGEAESFSTAIVCLAVFAAVVPLYFLFQADKERRAAEQVGLASVKDEWQRGESELGIKTEAVPDER
jgi:hypothetical protein